MIKKLVKRLLPPIARREPPEPVELSAYSDRADIFYGRPEREDQIRGYLNLVECGMYNVRTLGIRGSWEERVTMCCAGCHYLHEKEWNGSATFLCMRDGFEICQVSHYAKWVDIGDGTKGMYPKCRLKRGLVSSCNSCYHKYTPIGEAEHCRLENKPLEYTCFNETWALWIPDWCCLKFKGRRYPNKFEIIQSRRGLRKVPIGTTEKLEKGEITEEEAFRISRSYSLNEYE